jgi:hypothetical protein
MGLIENFVIQVPGRLVTKILKSGRFSISKNLLPRAISKGDFVLLDEITHLTILKIDDVSESREGIEPKLVPECFSLQNSGHSEFSILTFSKSKTKKGGLLKPIAYPIGLLSDCPQLQKIKDEF